MAATRFANADAAARWLEADEEWSRVAGGSFSVTVLS